MIMVFIFGMTTIIIMRVNLYDPFCGAIILGGNVYIMNGAQLGIKTIIHQNQVIGSYTMIGMGSIVTKKKKLLPGYIFFGKPIKKKGINKIGLKRNMISKDRLKKEVLRFNDIKKDI